MRLAVAIALVALVAVLDWATGSEISFSIFYLLPVAFAGILLARRAGTFVAILSAAVWGYLEITTGHPYSAVWIPYWNSAVRLGFFVIVNELIAVARLAQMREQLLSRTDAVTGVSNARLFEEHAIRVLAQSRRSGRPFTITYVDLDRFKQVNDEWGHSEGDRVLRTVATIIAGSARATDIVARLGGDEFGILMPDTGMEQARASLARIADTLKAGMQEHWKVGATFGAVTFTTPPDDVDSAVRVADTLMYEGKTAGRGRIVQATWPEQAEGERASGEFR